METRVLLREMEDYAAQHGVPIIRAQEHAIFVHAVQAAAPHHILEIGTAIGYSALLLAYYSPAGSSILTMEKDERRMQEAAAFLGQSPLREKISVLPGDAGENLARLSADPAYQGYFDFVFIDAAKGQYPDYLRKILPMLADQAVILSDNVLFRGYVTSEEKPPRRYKTIVKRLREYLAMLDGLGGQTKIYEDGDGLAVTEFRREDYAG